MEVDACILTHPFLRFSQLLIKQGGTVYCVQTIKFVDETLADHAKSASFSP